MNFFKGLFKTTQSYIKSGANDNAKRILLKGRQKTQVIQKIESIVFNAKFTPVSNQMQDICEKVHYSVTHDQPVRIDYLNQLLPNVNFGEINEEEYNEWLRYKHKMDSDQAEIIIDTQKKPEDEKQFNNLSKQDKVITSQEIQNSYKNRK